MSNRISTVIKAVTDLPARLFGGNAQKVEVSGLDYTLHLDLEKLPPDTVGGAPGKWTVVWDETTNTYRRVEFTNLPPPVGGVGLDDEAVDDRVAALLQAGSNIAIAYDDAGNRLTIHGIAPGGSTGPQNVFDTIHDARLATVPAAVKSIVLMGYDAPGDSGHPMACRRTAAQITYHDGWFRTADRYTDAGVTDSLNGGHWEYITKTTEVNVGWFGGKPDFRTVRQDGSGWNPVNPTPTDNHGPIMAATKFVWTTGGHGGIGTGGTVKFSRGQYYVDNTVVLDRASALEGVGSGIYHDGAQTFLYFRAGVTGFLIHSAGEGINGASGSVFRNIYIGCLGHGGQTTKHGIECRAPIFMHSCSVAGFGGNGISIAADVGGGTNANCFGLIHCWVYGNAVDGIFCVGGDSNAGFGYGINVMSNGQWGINDQSFLGNYWSGCHSSGNGNTRTGVGGGYRGAFSPIIFDGCYSESDQMPDYAGNHVMFKGGLHGAGVTCEGGSWETGSGRIGTMALTPPQGQNSKTSLGFLTAANEFETYYISNDTAFPNGYKNKYFPDMGVFLQFNDVTPHWSIGYSPPEGSTIRDPRIQPNSTFVGRGMYLGSTITGPAGMRQLAFDSGPPNQYAVRYLKGDVSFDAASNNQAGWKCIADGVNAPAWASGAIYNVGDLRRTPAGRVYQVTRVPYDPDRWTCPPVSVKPTHTTGTVMYSEPNPEIDPGETATIPGYKYTVIPDNPIYLPWDNWVGKVWATGGAMRVPETGIAYWCPPTAGGSAPGYGGPDPGPSVPVPPTPIFNTPWAMPGSTVEPTHTSGAVEYPQPNPSPSGTEPATIPGYIWRFVTTDLSAQWSSFGELFIDSARFQFNFTLNHGDRTAVQTVTVPGAKLGDFAKATTWNPYAPSASQGLLIIAWVSGDNEAKFQVHNLTGATVTLSLMDWYVRVFKGQN